MPIRRDVGLRIGVPGQADFVGHFVQHLPNLAQDVLGIGFQLRTTALEHGAVFFIDDLYAQAFAGNIQQYLVLEFLQFDIGLDRLFDIGFQRLEFIQLFFSFLPPEFFLGCLDIDNPFFLRQITRFHLTFTARQILTTTFDDAGTVAAARPAHQRNFEWCFEIFRNAVQFASGSGTQQPHEQKKRHHRRDEVGIGDLPGTTMGTTHHLFDALDDDGSFVFGRHG